MALQSNKGVIFILLSKFGECFSFFGMKTILVLYIRNKLNYSDDVSTKCVHIFLSFVYFFPLIGAIIADSWLGKFKTIFFLSIVHAFGGVIISFGAIPTLNLPQEEITIFGMLLIMVGGGMRSCMASFGGDQFKVPKEATALVTFFSDFYFIINAGAFLSNLVTPTLRKNVHCFGQEDCYPLAFGVSAILMVVSIVIFSLGRSFYTVAKPTGNMVVLVSKCISNAFVTKFKDRRTVARSYWLEYAEPKYGRTLVRDVKILLQILVLYLPLPFFWALFHQKSSRWTFQATRMNGTIGSINIKPDQMQVINPLLILAFIPLFNYIIYPVLSKIGIKRPLQKLTIGGILAAVAFMISGCIELKLESLDPVAPKVGQAELTNLCSQNFTEYHETPGNSVHMLWQVPQYVIMTAGEVMFSVTAHFFPCGLEFSYSQAPVSMKSVLQACWLLTIAVGNAIVVFLTSLKFFESQAIEFFFSAVLMIIDMGIFIFLAMHYKYVKYSEDKTPNEETPPPDSYNIPMEQKPNHNKDGITNKAFEE
ncbi:peptide transporter family 1-like [Sergentomyia squamirostris]